MVTFSDVDYYNVKMKVLKKLKDNEYFSGHVCGVTEEGVNYKLICYILNFKRDRRLCPVFWEMMTYNKYGDIILNDFSFYDIKWY